MAIAKRKRINLTNVVSKAKEGGKAGGISYLNTNLRRYVLHEKKNRLSIIPFEVTQAGNFDGIEPGELWYKASVLVHTQVGVNKQMILCPKMFNKRCPICEAEAELREQGAEWNDPDCQALRAKKREVYNVINEDKPEDGIQLLEASYNVFGKKLDAEIEDDEANGAFPDPDEGLIVVARGVNETFGNHKYIDIDKITFEERDALSDEVLDEALDLHKALKIMTYDEIVTLMNGDDEETPAPKSSKKRPTRSRDDDDEEEEEDETPRRRTRRAVEDDDEEDEQPRRRSSRRAIEEEDEEDEEDETPRHAARRGTKTEKPKDEPEEEENEAEEAEDDEPPFDPDPVPSDAGSDECEHFGKNCGYDDEVCDNCDRWRECRKANDEYLRNKRRSK